MIILRTKLLCTDVIKQWVNTAFTAGFYLGKISGFINPNVGLKAEYLWHKGTEPLW